MTGGPKTGRHPRYRRFSRYLRERYGCRVSRVTVNPGFGCPNLDGTLSRDGCIYCDNRAFSAAAEDTAPLAEQIGRGIERGRRRGSEKFLVYFQPYSNTHAPVTRMKEAYDVVRAFPDVVGLIVGTRPDCVDAEKLDLLASYRDALDVWVEYGLQSVHDRTLKLINRNHSHADFLRAVGMSRERGLKVCSHVIIGLPGETAEDIIATAAELGRRRLDGVKLHPLHVVAGTRLEQWHRAGAYRPLEMDDYVDLACRFLERLHPDTVIQRITADCPSGFLVAPDWLNDKHAVLAAIDRTLEQRDTRQGKLFK